MTSWSLRRVRVVSSGDPEEGLTNSARVYEVFYDDDHRPWGYADASLLDKVRYVRDWLLTSVLTHPDDFTGEQPGMQSTRCGCCQEESP